MLDKHIPFKERKRNREYGFKLADRNIDKEELKEAELLEREKIKMIREKENWLRECESNVEL